MSRTYFNKLLKYSLKEDLLNNTNRFRKLFTASFVKQIINDIVNNEDLLEVIASNSYEHYNGFDKIVLLENENFKIRLHSWDSNLFDKIIDENIHNHRWDFVTTIICGGYDLKMFQVVENGGEKYHQYLYNPPNNNEYYEMKYIGTNNLREVLSTHLQPKNYYLISKDLFHKVTPALGIYTVSLMVHGKNFNQDVYVFSKEKLNNVNNINSKRYTKIELKMKLEHISKQLRNFIKNQRGANDKYDNPHEILDVVDEKDRVIGQKSREEVYRNKSKNFRVVNAFVENDKGEVLILRRNPNKAYFPLGLDMSVGGHVKSGENYDVALERELHEELGLSLDKLSYSLIAYLNPYNSNLSSFSKTYKIKYNETPDYDKEEFLEHYWMKPIDVLTQIEKGDISKDDLPVLLEMFFK
jgi:isopentenyl-diphosphate delta-isomerase